MNQQSYTLYGGGPSRSMMTEMVLAEGGLPYELRDVDMFKGEHLTPEFRAINPLGWIPALVTPDGETIAETPAINLWLCEQHGLDLVPPAGSANRAAFLTWFHHIVGEVEPTLKRVFFAHRYTLTAEQLEETRAHAADMLMDRLAPLEQRLSETGPHLVGDRFTLADLTLCYWLPYVDGWGRLGDYPALAGALENARVRPALAPIFARQAAWIERLKR